MPTPGLSAMPLPATQRPTTAGSPQLPVYWTSPSSPEPEGTSSACQGWSSPSRASAQAHRPVSRGTCPERSRRYAPRGAYQTCHHTLGARHAQPPTYRTTSRSRSFTSISLPAWPTRPPSTTPAATSPVISDPHQPHRLRTCNPAPDALSRQLPTFRPSSTALRHRPQRPRPRGLAMHNPSTGQSTTNSAVLALSGPDPAQPPCGGRSGSGPGTGTRWPGGLPGRARCAPAAPSRDPAATTVVRGAADADEGRTPGLPSSSGQPTWRSPHLSRNVSPTEQN